MTTPNLPPKHWREMMAARVVAILKERGIARPTPDELSSALRQASEDHTALLAELAAGETFRARIARRYLAAVTWFECRRVGDASDACRHVLSEIEDPDERAAARLSLQSAGLPA